MTDNLWELIRSDLKANNVSKSGLMTLLYCYYFMPGFSLAFRYRLYHRLNKGGLLRRALAKILWRRSISKFGCYIHPSANIGAAFRLPHPVGIVIAGNSKIGAGVTIYQHVTIGRYSENNPVVPVIGDNTIIYTAATIFGNVDVEPNSQIAAHSSVIKKP